MYWKTPSCRPLPWAPLVALAFVACAALPAFGQPRCEVSGVKVYADFAGAGLRACEARDAAEPGQPQALVIQITPEGWPINPSPWYAFRLLSDRAVELRVTLDYGEVAEHRYPPKLRRGGGEWTALAEDALTLSPDSTEAMFPVSLMTGESVTVAAQPLLTSRHYADWIEGLVAAHGGTAGLEAKVIGKTPLGRDMWRLATPARPNTLLLLGRAHPPETTGAVALMHFVQRLLGDDALARDFRAEVGLLAYPLLNPDGVDRGHWRHNIGTAAGMDLNRDWGLFTAPETAMVHGDLMAFLADRDTRLIKSIDFHSTWYDVLYTQEDGTPTVLPHLLGSWLGRFDELMMERVPGFEINREPSNTTRPTAKGWFFQRFGIASTTFEIGDGTPPDHIATYAETAAEAFMTAALAATEPGSR